MKKQVGFPKDFDVQAAVDDFFSLLMRINFHAKFVLQIAGISHRQLTYWCDEGRLNFTIEGRNRSFTGKEVIKILMVKMCLDAGKSLDTAFKETIPFYTYFFEGADKPELPNSYYNNITTEHIITTFQNQCLKNLRFSVGDFESAGIISIRQITYWNNNFIVESMDFEEGDGVRRFNFEQILKAYLLGKYIFVKSRVNKKKAEIVDPVVQEIVNIISNKARKIHNNSKCSNYNGNKENKTNVHLTEEEVKEAIIAGQGFVISCYCDKANYESMLCSQTDFIKKALDTIVKTGALTGKRCLSVLFLGAWLAKTKKTTSDITTDIVREMIESSCNALCRDRLLIKYGQHYRLKPNTNIMKIIQSNWRNNESDTAQLQKCIAEELKRHL